MLIQMGSRLLQRMSPVGLVLAGSALVLAMPPVRRGIRAGAVLATRGVLMAVDTVRHTGSVIREELEDIAAEARETDCPMCSTTLEKPHRHLARATSQGLLTVSDKAKALSDKVKRYAEDQDHLQAPAVHDGLEDDDLSLKPS